VIHGPTPTQENFDFEQGGWKISHELTVAWGRMSLKDARKEVAGSSSTVSMCRTPDWTNEAISRRSGCFSYPSIRVTCKQEQADWHRTRYLRANLVLVTFAITESTRSNIFFQKL